MMLFNQTAIAKQLDSWQLLPRPQHVTELFFTNARHLPEAVRLGTEHDVAFTLHNIEHGQVTYHYTVSALSKNDGIIYPLKSGNTTVNHDQYKSMVESVKIPSVGPSIALRVDLNYQNIGTDGKIRSQSQSIQYWVKIMGF